MVFKQLGKIFTSGKEKSRRNLDPTSAEAKVEVMMAQLKRQAEQRAHEEANPPERQRPVPDGPWGNIAETPEERADRLMSRRKIQGYLFETILPFQTHEEPLSYFGGRPKFTPDLTWPETDFDFKHPHPSLQTPVPRALSFLGQIDLASLPQPTSNEEGQPHLPEHGTLYFFFDYGLDFTLQHDHFKGWVLYSENSAVGFPENQLPDNLPSYWGNSTGYHFEELETLYPDAAMPREVQRWPVIAHSVETSSIHYHDVLDEKNPADCTLPDAVQDRLNSQEKISTKPFCKDYGREASSTYRSPSDPYADQDFWIPPYDFPQAWNAIELMAAAVIIHYKQLQKDTDANQQAIEKTLLEAKDWAEQADRNGLYSAVSETNRRAFLDWVQNLPDTRNSNDTRSKSDIFAYRDQNHILTSRFHKAVSRCLAHSRESAALIHDELKRELEQVYLGKIVGNNHHVALGNWTLHERAPYDSKDPWILLMQFGSSRGPEWTFCDVENLQYWIRASDLRNRRFDRVKVGVE